MFEDLIFELYLQARLIIVLLMMLFQFPKVRCWDLYVRELAFSHDPLARPFYVLSPTHIHNIDL